ncbi:MAG: hypothetical protein GY944_01390 [bacterium]|nr:hypothetical protein [bacterium]
MRPQPERGLLDHLCRRRIRDELTEHGFRSSERQLGGETDRPRQHVPAEPICTETERQIERVVTRPLPRAHLAHVCPPVADYSEEGRQIPRDRWRTPKRPAEPGLASPWQRLHHVLLPQPQQEDQQRSTYRERRLSDL